MNGECVTESLKNIGVRLVAEAGIKDAELLSSVGGTGFDDGYILFRVGSLLVRITRDRGQLFLDLGSVHSPEHFHQFDDVEIAMGWRSIASVLAKTEPEALKPVLTRLREHREELETRMSEAQERLTRARIERAAHDRGEAFAESLR